MSVITSFSRFVASASSVYRSYASPLVPPPTQDPNSAITTYRVMRAMYEQNGLYEEIQALLNQQSIWHEAMQPLRNPANRVVEFYAAKLCPGAKLADALPIIDTTRGVERAIEQVWTWSNWASQKQVASRWSAIYGDLFVKVVGKTDPGTEPKVHYQLLEPETATQIDADVRGFLTYLRLDVPQVRREQDGTEKSFTLTEVWDKKADRMRLWEHDKGAGAELKNLGAPAEDHSILSDFGIDFIPVVHTRFKDIGDLRGSGAFLHAVDKINEANRMATRLHQMLFRHNSVTWALQANMMTGDNRPLPPPRVGSENGAAASDGVVTVGDERMYRLPGMSTIVPLVPQLQYEAALNILKDMMLELEHDLPELAYYRLRDLGADLSGRAVRLLLSDAVDRAVEARGNFEAGLVRANQMALTIGNKIKAFSVDGTFEKGDFDHSFKDRPIIPTSDLEDAQASLAEAQAGMLWEQLGVSKQQILRDKGFSNAEIAKMTSEREADVELATQRALDAFGRGQGLGNQGSPVPTNGRTN